MYMIGDCPSCRGKEALNWPVPKGDHVYQRPGRISVGPVNDHGNDI